ncbi:MAG: hypothetical protein H7178_13220 [Chitinophagaceae bacterium]|nr:hypothetical protein [Chitinophagaceae bacterium]
MTKIYFVFILFNLTTANSFGQTPAALEIDIMNTQKSITGIGTVIFDSIIVKGKKQLGRKYVTIGSGLVTYSKVGATSIYSFVTAKHVINFFIENKIKSIYIRPSWADTIKTTEYFGVEIPLVNSDGTPNYFLYPESNIDLGTIIMLPNYADTMFVKQINNTVIFPYNQMTTSFLGEQVWIAGYPDHIDIEFQNRFFYSMSTFKPGHIAWKPAPNMDNKDLNHITLIECNATHGNSGGPVFSLNNQRLELEGILVGGYEESNKIYINNRTVTDSSTKNDLVSKGRSGVSIMEKAEYVKRLEAYVEAQIIEIINKTKK